MLITGYLYQSNRLLHQILHQVLLKQIDWQQVVLQNSFTFLRGDQNYAPAVQSIKGAETRYFARLYSQASNGANSLIFTTNSDALIGHTVVSATAGIQANTNINGVTTVGGLTTVSLNNPVNATIPAGTVIEFERGTSPLTFDSSNTVGGFIDSVVIANPGSGYTDGQYFDISLDGGAWSCI